MSQKETSTIGQKGENMLKVLSNLRKTFWQVVVIIFLLCVQATTDLALPDYTSKIVNIGIQAGGIEVAVPDIVAKEDMETLLIFVGKEEQVRGCPAWQASNWMTTVSRQVGPLK